MYRDDVCAVCGESLPPDHFYCREHAAQVDARLHEIGALLGRVTDELPRLVGLLEEIAPETWDWLADEHGEDRALPITPPVVLRVHAEEVDVDVDTEPGQVRIDLQTSLHRLLAAVCDGLGSAGAGMMAQACAEAEGANATH